MIDDRRASKCMNVFVCKVLYHDLYDILMVVS
jgi:hypothetical protein